MFEREVIIRNYFDGWINKDKSILEKTFANNVIYSESHGPEYHGLKQINQWFTRWNEQGKVIKWDIKQFIHGAYSTAVEWYFQCEHDGKIEGFDGVSIVEFTTDYKIKSLKEFQSKAEHTYPYAE